MIPCRWLNSRAAQMSAMISRARRGCTRTCAPRPFVAMRPGDLMHRLAQRLFGGTPPPETFPTEGTEMGDTLVVTGTCPAILPDYSIAGDPLETAGVITARRRPRRCRR
ncbi:hypothetical protein AB0C31_42805, partial [Actinoplanes philippinensis]